MKTVLFVVGAILLGILAIRYETIRKNKKIAAAFSGRERLSEEQFYERFFQDQGMPFCIVAGVKKILAEQLEADMSRLIDEDDFSKNLRFFWDFDSMADVEIISALEKEFSIKISDAEAENTHTVKDIVKLVARKLEAGKQ